MIWWNILSQMSMISQFIFKLQNVVSQVAYFDSSPDSFPYSLQCDLLTKWIGIWTDASY